MKKRPDHAIVWSDFLIIIVFICMDFTLHRLRNLHSGVIIMKSCIQFPSSSTVRDFISGILMGLSVVEILAGIGIVGKKLLKQ